MPSTPRKPLYSYTQANPRSDESQGFDAAWTDVEDEAVEQDSGFVEFGSSDCNQNHTFWYLSPALSQQEATDSEIFTERQLSNFPPEHSISGSPATSLAILDFSSPLPPLTRSAVHKSPPARHVSPDDFSDFSHSDHAYNQPDLDSHSFIDAPAQYEDNPENTDFGRNSSRKSCFISDKSYDKPVTLGTFLDDPDPWNAIGRFLNLAPLIHNNNHSSVSSNSRAGVGWSSSCSVSSSDNSGDNNEYGMDVESQGPSALSPALSASSLTMAIDAILSRSCSPALPEHSSPNVWLESSRPDFLPSSAMDLSVSGSSQSSSNVAIDQSRVNAAPRSMASDLPEILQSQTPSPPASVYAADPKTYIRGETPVAIEPFSATVEESIMAEDDTKSDTTDASRKPEVLCLFADGALEAEESDEEGFM
ncbi:hypothetical protein EWM64_g3698 [Hericium alpestre]|uniref:Uncharacterized protein n=1 Tax=Hericium alpestre TaxID=135208 RepID=A0A4Z0A1V5_9AGAM|nr:hypothetical protein EWM64_g3698 [Hericium alpestre]